MKAVTKENAMYRKLKTVLTTGIILFFMLISFVENESIASAAEFADAENISVNDSITGNTEKGYDAEEDYYKFTVTDSGYVVLNFSNVKQKNSDICWKMYLYNSDYVEICATDISGAQTSTDSAAIGVAAGTYYVKVNSADKAAALSTDIYTIQVNYITSEVWEKEFNENFVEATPIQLDETYYGTTRTGCGYEKDYYSFSIEKNGCIKICFSNPLQKDSGEYWKIYVYNSQYEEIYHQTITGNQSSTNLPVIGAAAGKYYLQVESVEYYTASSSDSYNIKVTYEASDLWEQEINDDYTTATSIKVGSQYSGTILNGSGAEKDFFKFTISSGGLYSIGITTPNLYNDDSYWIMYLYDSSCQELAQRTVYGNETFHSISQNLTAGSYYIKIVSKDYFSAASKMPYQLKVAATTKTEAQKHCNHEYQIQHISATYFSKGYKLYKCGLCGYSYKADYSAKKVLAKGKLSSYCRSGAGRLNLQWYSVSGASGYAIRYSKNKKMKGAKTQTVKGESKRKATIKKLSRRKKYYVQVRAYKKSGTKTIYGKWSSKKCLKTK